MHNHDDLPTIGKSSRDYTADLIAVRPNGPKEYLQAKHALQLLRDLWPQARISTTLLHYQRAVKDMDTNKFVGGYAVVHARVNLPDGSEGEAHGSETVEDFPEFLEKAETKAIRRALSAAGVGIQYGGADFEYEEKNPRDFKGAISDAKPTEKPKPITGAVVDFASTRGRRMPAEPDPRAVPQPEPEYEEPSAAEVVDQHSGEIDPEPMTHTEANWILLIDDAVKTGKKSNVLMAWAQICRAAPPTTALQNRYKIALTKVN